MNLPRAVPRALPGKLGHDTRVIHKVTHKTPVCILEEESEHQTFLCTKRRLKKIWTGV